MTSLLAQIHDVETSSDERRAIRRSVRLGGVAFSTFGASRALVTDLSEAGFRIETSKQLKVGDVLELELPEAGVVTARVVWTKNEENGCEFLELISLAAVSAARLLTPFDTPSNPDSMPTQVQVPVQNLFPVTRTRQNVGLLSNLALALLMVATFSFLITLLALPLSADQF